LGPVLAAVGPVRPRPEQAADVADPATGVGMTPLACTASKVITGGRVGAGLEHTPGVGELGRHRGDGTAAAVAICPIGTSSVSPGDVNDDFVLTEDDELIEE
jgi:hypothetical protein